MVERADMAKGRTKKGVMDLPGAAVAEAGEREAVSVERESPAAEEAVDRQALSVERESLAASREEQPWLAWDIRRARQRAAERVAAKAKAEAKRAKLMKARRLAG